MRKGLYIAQRQSEAQAISHSVREKFEVEVARIEDYVRRYEFLPRVSKIRRATENMDFIITDDFCTIPIALKLLGNKIPLIIRARGDYRREVDSRINQGIFTGPVKYASGKILAALFEQFAEPSLIIPVCNHLAENLSHLNANTCTVYNGVDLRRFDPGAVGRKSEYSENFSGRKIGIIFNFNIYKKVASLKVALERFKFLLEFENGVVLLIAGDGTYRKQIEKTARDIGLEENVRFLGFINKIEEFISACDVIWHPSLLDELPTSILECMAMEKPVISFDTGGIPEIITHQTDGFLVNQGDYDKFREYTIQLFENEKLKQKIEKNARKKIESKFNWELSGKKFVKCLEELR